MKSPQLLIFGLLLALFLSATLAHANFLDRERPFRKGRGGAKGNERSERVSRIGVGNASFAGNGCPAGTMSVIFAPDNLSFSILFDQFVAEVGNTSRQKKDVMACNAVIPMEIPEGMQMEITRVDYRGFVAIPQGGRAVLHSIFNFTERGSGADRDKINLRYRFDGPLTENYEISTAAVEGGRNAQTEASPCGGRTNLRIRNNLQVRAGARGENAQVTLDSIDGSGHAIYYVSWKRCQEENRNDRGGRARNLRR